ncbi:MAG: putative nucleotidyltransferase [Candidatus Latescibacterota bacterium]
MKDLTNIKIRLIQRIREVVTPSKIILFGSAARQEMDTNSDLDILIVVPNGVPRRKTAQDIYMKLLDFEISVDIVVATEKDIELYGDNFSLVYYSALKDGQEIYVAPELQSRVI